MDLTAEAMGTKIRLVSDTTHQISEDQLNDAFAAALTEIRRLEALMTTWKPDSELSQVNANPGQWRTISRETLEVLQKSRWASELSGGAFDITFRSMGNIWKFGDAAEASPQLPDPQLLKQRIKLIDFHKVELDAAKSQVRLAPNTSVDLGGIAKGYAVDRAANILKQRGVQSFLLQAGGDLYGAGVKPDGTPWTSGIRDPRGEKEEPFALIQLQDHAFSTAGDYARAFILDGKRYHHIIDPKTGYPATRSRSVTIWSKDAFTADAIDDAVFILGPEKGLPLVESLDGVGVVIVDSKNHVLVSPRLEGKVHVLSQPTDGL
ncbi:MAG TPA: FAD:protein FMN transferase [Polyangiaceae bacterium]|nr:FAD:protein FMN transferase [Polyangiaceae bacterium]